MKTILVTKTGMSFTSRAFAKGNALGEQGDTEGVMRHLVHRGDVRVVYYGKFRGDIISEGICHAAIQSDTEGLDEDSIGSESGAVLQRDLIAHDAEKLAAHEPVAFLEACGPPSTFSRIDNPKGSRVLVQGIRYTAPQLGVMHALRLPRLCLVNDIRCYPRDQEMSYGWPEARPVALLDQVEQRFSKVVGGVPYWVHARYGALESMCHLPPRAGEPWQRRLPCQVFMHAHVEDGFRKEGRRDSMHKLFGEWPSMPVYGKGWEHVFEGMSAQVLSPQRCLDEMARTLCSPCVACQRGYRSNKPYVLVSQGCIPVMYGGDEDEFAKWPYEQVPFRATRPGDLEEIARLFSLDETLYRDTLTWWKQRLRRDTRVVDAMVNDVIDGTLVDGAYGGYERRC